MYNFFWGDLGVVRGKKVYMLSQKHQKSLYLEKNRVIMKLLKRGFYYFGMDKRRFKCTKVGSETSYFVDGTGVEHQFYNEDMFTTRYSGRKKSNPEGL